MTHHKIYIGLAGQSRAAADQMIADLEAFLAARTNGITLNRSKLDPNSQEIGSLLVAILAAPAVVELAKGLADWMRKRNATVTLSADGSKTIEGPATDVDRMLNELLTNEKQ